MSETNSKIRLKIGLLEVKFEGSEDFIKDDLMEIISSTLDEYTERAGNIPVSTDAAETKVSVAKSSAESFDLSTSTIASLTKASSGSDLVMAAAAHLTLTKGQEKMTRAELNTEMQTATSYYNVNFSKNLSNYLDSLVKADRLRLLAKDTYGMSAKEKESMRTQLAAG